MSGDDAILQALAQAREAAGEEGELYGFYERLVRASASRKAAIDLPAASLLQEGEASALAREGEPHLRFDSLNLAPGSFQEWVQQVASLFESRDPGVAEEMADWSAADLLDLARLWYETGSARQGPTVDAVLGNALAPYLEHAAARLIPLLPLHIWRESYCPVCGGFPDFALWSAAQDTLLSCERCRATWSVPLDGCFFCGESDPDAWGLYSTEDELYRVEVCDTCGFYLKGMNREALPPGEPPLLAAERLLTPGLDLLALQEGYTRPVGASGAIEEE